MLPDVLSLKKESLADKASSLGLQWHIARDTFSIKAGCKDAPLTKRGLLKQMMSVYDPQGMAVPATLTNKLLFRDLTPRKEEDPHCTAALRWDDPIPHQFKKQWDQMQTTCQDVESLEIPRSFYPAGHGTPVHQQLFAFADASDLAWCYVIYLRTINTDGCIQVVFVYGGTRILPKSVSIKGQLSIPRAELGAAKKLAEKVLEIETQLDLPNRQPTTYYSDSSVVLDWIKKASTKEPLKRYVMSRIQYILNVSSPDQWHYIPMEINPADLGTRPITVKDLQASS